MAANSRFAVATHIMLTVATMKSGAHGTAVGGDGLVCSSVIAASVNTNPVVVRRLVAELAKAGLVVSQQGKGGGVRLARPASRITLFDIYQAIGEDPVFAFNPNAPNPKCPLSVKMLGVLAPVFGDVQDAVRGSLRRTRLADLVRAVG